MLPVYRSYGLLAVTVGLQGGGSIYEPEVYDHYRNTAFAADGSLKPAYFERLARVLAAADAAGMVVIVNFFYWRQLHHLNGDDAILRATQAAAAWLIQSGFRNILVDVMNEFRDGPGLLQSGGIHRLIEIVRAARQDGRRLLVSSSQHPEYVLLDGPWQDLQDFYIPHGNDVWADELRQRLQRIKASPAFRANPRPLLINEDSIHINSLEAAAAEYTSWGYYSQGYGCGGSWQHGRFNWLNQPRETRFEDLSGYQTVPVNWGINTDEKRAFFEKVAEITASTPQV
jgi:nicotinamidase-related amidase